MLTARCSAFGFARPGSAAVNTLSVVAAALLGLSACASGAQQSGSTAGVTAEGPATGGIAAPPPPAPPPAPAPAPVEGGGAACASDSDCVPASCCHPRACVPRGQAPACQGMMCTQNCAPGTLDCGGSCLCQQGRCAARLREAQ